MDIKQARPLIEPLIRSFVSDHMEILVASACTEDGFVIAHCNGRKLNLEDDKIAALSSTLMSMSEAAARVINSGDLRVVILEAKKANLVVIKTHCLDLAIVLTVAAESSISIGQARFLTDRLANRIAGV